MRARASREVGDAAPGPGPLGSCIWPIGSEIVVYRIRTPGHRKRDQVMRWALSDRVFFACGACHILAYAFLDKYDHQTAQALWLKPDAGFTGNHIVVDGPGWIFDYHGYSDRERYLAHTHRKANHWWPGWQASLIVLPQDALISEAKSRTYEGLWLREPEQFLHDALPRARSYLNRFPPPTVWTVPAARSSRSPTSNASNSPKRDAKSGDNGVSFSGA